MGAQGNSILVISLSPHSENHSPELQCCFLQPFDWDKPASDTKHDDPGIDHLRFKSTQDTPVLPGGMGSNYALKELLALRAKDLSNQLLFASRRALIHSVQRLIHLLFDKL